MKRPIEVKFYDGILAEGRCAWIVPDQQQGIVLKLDEDVPVQVSAADLFFLSGHGLHWWCRWS